MGCEPIEEDEWGTVVALELFLCERNTRLPTGREPYGNGVLVVVAGVTPRRGEWESHSQGEGEQEIEDGR